MTDIPPHLLTRAQAARTRLPATATTTADTPTVADQLAATLTLLRGIRDDLRTATPTNAHAMARSVVAFLDDCDLG